MLNNMSHAQRVMNQSQTKADLTLFRKAFANGKMARIIATIINSDNQLLSLEEITEGKEVYTRSYCGLTTVPIIMIQGSESRSEDFDQNFNPLKKHEMHRWMRVAEMRLKGRPLPAVELIQIGKRYIVIDGHHRISVARALGEKFIEANVTRWE